MALLSTLKNPDLVDWTKATDPNGQIAAVIEMLNQTNEILDDMVMKEGNLPTGEQTTIRSGIPEGTWRRLYGGVQPTKSRRVQVTESCGMLEAYNEVDKKLADLNGNTNAFRMSEAYAQIEGMNQQVARQLFYGSKSDPERFEGLTSRYNDIGSGAPENADNIIDGGGTGTDNASIWLVCWGTQSCCTIYPRGIPAGLQVSDKGQVTIEDIDGSGGRMEAYRMHFSWDIGLVLKDWRYVVRIANIDRSDLAANNASAADLPELMFQAMDLIPNLGQRQDGAPAAMSPAFYMDRRTKTALRQKLSREVSNSTLQIEQVGGVRTEMFQGLPLRRVDALAVNEARVT